jgi:hypothetical protein
MHIKLIKNINRRFHFDDSVSYKITGYWAAGDFRAYRFNSMTVGYTELKFHKKITDKIFHI